jgi:hypothetical protein
MPDTKNNRPLVRNTGWKRINEHAVGENIIMRVQLLSNEAKHGKQNFTYLSVSMSEAPISNIGYNTA